MEKYAICSFPDLLQFGLGSIFLFYDRLVVPDQRYVKKALYEIDHPEFFGEHNSWDPTGEKTISEVLLGLGYYLWPNSNVYDSSSLKKMIKDLNYIQKEGLISNIPIESNYLESYRGSFQELELLQQKLDEDRIRTALQMIEGEYVDVSLVRYNLSNTSLTQVPPKIDKRAAMRFLLKKIPIPAKEIPIDEIISFKTDQAVKNDLNLLRSWIVDITNQDINVLEFEDKFLASYQSYIKSLKHLSAKSDTSTIGLISTIGATVVDNLTQLKLGSAVKAVLDWQSTLIEIEEKFNKLPGRELTYLKKVEDAFKEDK